MRCQERERERRTKENWGAGEGGKERRGGILFFFYCKHMSYIILSKSILVGVLSPGYMTDSEVMRHLGCCCCLWRASWLSRSKTSTIGVHQSSGPASFTFCWKVRIQVSHSSALGVSAV